MRFLRSGCAISASDGVDALPRHVARRRALRDDLELPDDPPHESAFIAALASRDASADGGRGDRYGRDVKDTPFVPSEHHAATIWRYIDFPKYVSMLCESAIYFHRADRYDRLFEGTLPELDVRESFAERRRDVEALLARSRIFGDAETAILEGLERWYRRGPSSVFLSCWHINEHENFAMWHIFGSVRQAVAVSTSLGRLRASLERDDVFVGEVQYFDYATDRIDSAFHRAMPFMYKRKVYEYEREARAVYFREGARDDDIGHLEPVDLRALVDRVIVAPYAGRWFERAVRRVTTELGYDFDIARSSMEL